MSAVELTQEQIRERGLRALRDQLGVVAMVRFLQGMETGWGNYTEDRQRWLGDPDLNTLVEEIRERYPAKDK